MVLGIDIGGSKINFVLLASPAGGLKNQKILKREKVATPQKRAEIIGLLTGEIKKFKVQKAGIGVPGPLNKKGDLILNPPNLKALWNCPLAKIIEKETGIKTKMDNDANCFALAETLLGAGKGAEIVFGITLGTGVGGGLVIDGKIYRGAFGSAGEAGHMTIKFDGPRCTCGSSGCLEEYASERFFRKRGLRYNEYGRYLGIGLSNVINLFDPQVIVIGGGISSSYQDFIQIARKEMAIRVISPLSKKYVKIKKAALGEWAGAAGAALLHYA